MWAIVITKTGEVIDSNLETYEVEGLLNMLHGTYKPEHIKVLDKNQLADFLVQNTKMGKVDFSTSNYQFAHGKKPGGSGWWLFQVGETTVEFQGLYSLGKKRAMAVAREMVQKTGKQIYSITVLS